MKSTGHRVTLYSFGERTDGGKISLTVNVLGAFNLVTFERRVFGIDPDDLEPCDLPEKGEPVGALLTEENDIESDLEATRPDRMN
jgi:hypothetical protein